MMERERDGRREVAITDIEALVPENHLVRKIEKVMDYEWIYERVAPYYSAAKNVRPGTDPVVLVKYLLVGFLYGIPSERQIEQRIQTDVALRWYLGLDLFDRVPDHSTISQLRRRKPSFRKIFRRLFEEIVRQCVPNGPVTGRLVGTDLCEGQCLPCLGGADGAPGEPRELLRPSGHLRGGGAGGTGQIGRASCRERV